MKPLTVDDPAYLGGIRLRARLGTGAMGQVYYGIASGGDPVAVKVIKASVLAVRTVRERFDREADALRMAASPYVAVLVDAAVPDEEPAWLAMEYIRGLTLDEYVKRFRSLPAAAVAATGLVIADGLRDLHAAGLRHRDLKPSNIVLGADGPRIIDLGLVAMAGSPKLTATGDPIGTPVCMAPEQILYPDEVGPAADWYSLGATLLYAATGHYPYSGRTPGAVRQNAADSAVPPDLSGLPEPLTEVVTALLAANPDDRAGYDDTRAFLTAVPPMPPADLAMLTYVAGEDPPADSPPARPVPRPRRTPSEVPDVVRRVAAQLRGAYALGTAL